MDIFRNTKTPWTAEDCNEAARTIEEAQRQIVHLESGQTIPYQAEKRVRITARNDTTAPSMFSWERLFDAANGTLALESQNPMVGGPGQYPAFCTRGNANSVPLDGTAIVTLRPSENDPSYWFEWDVEEVFAVLGSEIGNGTYNATQFGRGNIGWAATLAGYVGSVYEANGRTGIANGTFVQLHRGYCPGAVLANTDYVQHGNNASLATIQFLALQASGGNFTFEFWPSFNFTTSENTSVIAWNATSGDVATALNALVISPGAWSVGGTGVASDPWTINFPGFLNYPLLGIHENLTISQEWIFFEGGTSGNTTINSTFNNTIYSNSTFNNTIYSNSTFNNTLYSNNTLNNTLYSNNTLNNTLYSNCTFNNTLFSNNTFNNTLYNNVTLYSNNTLYNNSTFGGNITVNGNVTINNMTLRGGWARISLISDLTTFFYDWTLIYQPPNGTFASNGTLTAREINSVTGIANGTNVIAFNASTNGSLNYFEYDQPGKWARVQVTSNGSTDIYDWTLVFQSPGGSFPPAGTFNLTEINGQAGIQNGTGVIAYNATIGYIFEYNPEPVAIIKILNTYESGGNTIYTNPYNWELVTQNDGGCFPDEGFAVGPWPAYEINGANNVGNNYMALAYRDSIGSKIWFHYVCAQFALATISSAGNTFVYNFTTVSIPTGGFFPPSGEATEVNHYANLRDGTYVFIKSVGNEYVFEFAGGDVAHIGILSEAGNPYAWSLNYSNPDSGFPDGGLDAYEINGDNSVPTGYSALGWIYYASGLVFFHHINQTFAGQIADHEARIAALEVP